MGGEILAWRSHTSLQIRRRAVLFQYALFANRISCLADLPAVRDEQMRKDDPVLLRHQGDEIVFDFLRMLFFG